MVYTKIDAGYVEVKVGENIHKWLNSRSKKYKEYRKKWEENPTKHIVEKFPLNLDLEVSRRCNLRCTMCLKTTKMKKGEKMDEGDIDFELAKKIIDEGAENGLYGIKFNYFGEPLMNPKLPELIKYAKNKGIIDVMINTNGVLLNEKMSRKIIESGLDKLFISVDSPNKEHYEKIRSGANFDTVIDNIKRFVKIRKELGKISPVVRVCMVVMKENLNEVYDYIKLWAPIVDLISFGDYVNMGGIDEKENERILNPPEIHKDFICPQLYQRIFVHWNGQIGLCGKDYNPKMGLGNANNMSIKEVWLGEKMKTIRKLHETGQYKKIFLCKDCEQKC